MSAPDSGREGPRELERLRRERDLLARLLELGHQDDPTAFLTESLALVQQLCGAQKGYLELGGDGEPDARWWTAAGCDDAEIDGIRVAGRPAVGTALIGGAMENLSPFLGHVPPFRRGCPRRVFTGGGHTHKRIVGGFLQRLVLPRKGFPRTLLVQTFKLGE